MDIKWQDFADGLNKAVDVGSQGEWLGVADDRQQSNEQGRAPLSPACRTGI